jgi:DNA polymerase-3 subunit gamma/tau
VETDTRDMLGVIERHFVLDIVRHLHEKNGSGVLEESQKISERAVSYPDVVADLIDLFYRIAVAQIVPAAVTDAAGEKEALCGYAKLFAPETIQLFYQLALNGRQDIAVAPDPRIAFEMLLLRLLTFSPVTPPSRNKMIEGGAGASDSAAPVSSTSLSSGVSNVSVAPNASIASNASIAQNASIAPNDSAKRGVATHTDTSAVSSQIAQAECDREGKGADTRLDSTEGEADIHELEEWGTALAKLKISGLVLQLALNCCVKYFTPSKVVFQLDNKNSHLKSPAQVDRLIAALNERYGALEVTIESVSDLIHTPAQQAERAEADRLLHAQQTLLDDPAFSAIMERFDAKIQSGSIKPH